jgi:hypothetical protein
MSSVLKKSNLVHRLHGTLYLTMPWNKVMLGRISQLRLLPMIQTILPQNCCIATVTRHVFSPKLRTLGFGKLGVVLNTLPLIFSFFFFAVNAQGQLSIATVQRLYETNSFLAERVSTDEELNANLVKSQLLEKEIAYFLSEKVANEDDQIALLAVTVAYSEPSITIDQSGMTPATLVLLRFKAIHDAFLKAQSRLWDSCPERLDDSGNLFWSVMFTPSKLSDFIELRVHRKEFSLFVQELREMLRRGPEQNQSQQDNTLSLSQIIDPPYFGADWWQLEGTRDHGERKIDFRYRRVSELLWFLTDERFFGSRNTIVLDALNRYLSEVSDIDILEADIAKVMLVALAPNPVDVERKLALILQNRFEHSSVDGKRCACLAKVELDLLPFTALDREYRRHANKRLSDAQVDLLLHFVDMTLLCGRYDVRDDYSDLEI